MVTNKYWFQFGIKISRASKNYSQQNFSQSYREEQKKEKSTEGSVWSKTKILQFPPPSRERQSFRNSQTTPAEPSSLLNQILTVHFHPFRLSLIQHTDQSSFFHPLENPFSHSLRIDTPVGKSIEIIVLADFNIFSFDELYFVVKPHYLHITHTPRQGYDEISKEKKYIFVFRFIVVKILSLFLFHYEKY